jgi:hypothetical protein
MIDLEHLVSGEQIPKEESKEFSLPPVLTFILTFMGHANSSTFVPQQATSILTHHSLSSKTFVYHIDDAEIHHERLHYSHFHTQ